MYWKNRIKQLELEICSLSTKVKKLDQRTCTHEFCYDSYYQPYSIYKQYKKECINCGLEILMNEDKWKDDKKQQQIDYAKTLS